MDRYSIVAPNDVQGPQAVSAKSEDTELSKASVAEPLRFPGDDGGRSLSEMAQRDLNAALQLLTERAQYITGASGAAIALRDGGEMICRASAGPSAPELGAHLQVDSGLSGESVRTRQILRCDDAENDSRVNRESCRSLGIASVMVMPLLREQDVMGVFELFSGRVSAFEERDIVALQRIAEMIQTAVEHADAAERAEKEIAGEDQSLKGEVETVRQSEATTELPPKAQEPTTEVAAAIKNSDAPTSTPALERLTIHKCSSCGFPVSEGRALCLDCETAQATVPRATTTEGAAYAPRFGTGEVEEPGWMLSHPYLVGALVAIVVIVVSLWLRSR